MLFRIRAHYPASPLMLSGLLDFLFPKTCFGCGEWGAYVCADCLNKIKEKRERICPVCTKPAIDGQTHPRCKNSYSLDGLTSVFAYSGLLAKIIRKLKYRFTFAVVQDLAELFLSSLGEDEVFSWVCRQKPILVPVTLHPARQRWRGFNQSELLGRQIAKNLGIKFIPKLLIRIKDTKTQSLLDKKKRQENIKDAFIQNGAYPKSSPPAGGLNSKYLLFDDVWTTGATLRECCRVLKRNGASFVWGLTLAS